MKTKTIVCPSCKTIFTGAIANDTWKCPTCGYKFISQEKVDTVKPSETNNYNEYSSTKNGKQEKIISEKNPTIVFKLCAFFGFLGLHRFYLKKYITGIIYLCTFGLFTIGWIMDIIRLLLGSFKDGTGAYIDHIGFIKNLSAEYRKEKLQKLYIKAQSNEMSTHCHQMITTIRQGCQQIRDKYVDKND